ncbi:sec-independent protein translocase protein TATB, chloroplastic-like isoform X1 [Hibiscus syriacus]|uniref:sec-independent protein translocase protein TATB, chloroplastic-like isoform X1 n=1 Tax=Hibiscus syriacus TaxID=106335 RepID=UPI0019227D7F|nr:sec-independent protein translocase protein TATB, chloroplastic-like isoform X1 [Hibiscus syriacus]
MSMAMASSISLSTSLCTSFATSKSANCCLSPLLSHRKASPFRFSTWFPQLGPSIFSQWTGLKHLGISISPKSLKLERRGRSKGKVVHASLFGVGAPEALVIGVVALLVFGPKGLAEVARNLGKTLRAFQPTIKELQEVSREFKSTLEREIGLDEMPSSTQNTPNRNSPYISKSPPTPSPVTSAEETGSEADPMFTPVYDVVVDYLCICQSYIKKHAIRHLTAGVTQSVNEAYTSEEYLKITEEQLKASASKQQGQTASPGETEPGSPNQDATPKETMAGAMPPSRKPDSET